MKDMHDSGFVFGLWEAIITGQGNYMLFNQILRHNRSQQIALFIVIQMLQPFSRRSKTWNYEIPEFNTLQVKYILYKMSPIPRNQVNLTKYSWYIFYKNNWEIVTWLSI